MAKTKNAKNVYELFGSWGVKIVHGHMSHPDKLDLDKNSGIDQACWGPFSEPTVERTDPLKYSELVSRSGDFYWLQGGDESTHSPWEDEEEQIARALARLVTQAAVLGLTVPFEFLQFMQNRRWIGKLALGDNSFHFAVGPVQVVRVRPSERTPFELVPGAFVMRFLVDHYIHAPTATSCCVRESVHFYLDRAGRHCVLRGDPISTSELSQRPGNMQSTAAGTNPEEREVPEVDVNSWADNADADGWACDVDVVGFSVKEFLARTHLMESTREHLTYEAYFDDQSLRPDS